MSKGRATKLNYSTLEIDGARYAVLRESALLAILREAGRGPQARTAASSPDSPFDGAALAERLRGRRQGIGLSQAGLARLAGVRVETLNRIERGHTTPDFSTIRKLVEAMQEFEIKQSRS